MCQGAQVPGKNMSLALSAALLQGTWTGTPANNTSIGHNSARLLGRLWNFTFWDHSASLVVTRGILVIFFSSAYLYAEIKLVVLPNLRSQCDRLNGRPGGNATTFLMSGFLRPKPPRAGTFLIRSSIVTIHERVSPLTGIHWFSAPETGTQP